MSDEKCSCTGSPPSLPLITIGKLLRGQSDGILERLFALCEKNRRTQLWDALFYSARMWDFSDLLVFFGRLGLYKISHMRDFYLHPGGAFF